MGRAKGLMVFRPRKGGWWYLVFKQWPKTKKKRGEGHTWRRDVSARAHDREVHDMNSIRVIELLFGLSEIIRVEDFSVAQQQLGASLLDESPCQPKIPYHTPRHPFHSVVGHRLFDNPFLSSEPTNATKFPPYARFLPVLLRNTAINHHHVLFGPHPSSLRRSSYHRHCLPGLHDAFAIARRTSHGLRNVSQVCRRRIGSTRW